MPECTICTQGRCRTGLADSDTRRGRRARRRSGRNDSFLFASQGGAIEETKTNLPTTGGQFEVVLTNGRAVRVTGSFQPEALSNLLAVVEGMKSC